MSSQSTPTNCAALLKALADETRLSVVKQLMERPMHVAELNESLGVEQSLLSHHLKLLRESELVTAKRDGKNVLYSLSPQLQTKAGRESIDLGCCLISFHS